MGVGVLLGTAAFAGLAMLLAGTLRAEATLALANGLYLGMLLLGDAIVAVDRLPETLASAARILPAAPLAGVFGASVGARPLAGSDLVVLAVWAAVTTLLAARLFSWEER
jgi:ABC-2 type transport system permease protein